MTSPPCPVEILVSSGGSGEPALDYVADAFHRATGHVARVAYNQDIDTCDVVVAARAALERTFRPNGKVEPGGVCLGRVGLGVAIRPGAVRPAIGSVLALSNAVLATDRLLITENHTSGLYVEAMLRNLGLHERMAPRIERACNAPRLMDRLLAGAGDEFAILSMNEIRTYADKGLILVGPLPDAVQYWVEFFAVPMTTSRHKAVAWQFAEFCGTHGRRLLTDHGFSLPDR